MIVKMIQNLENKMELQINSLGTRIEKMQERFNKDLEEIKKSQYIMNNAINEIKNTLKGTNSRIMEAEDRRSEVEDRIVEINEAERKRKKRIKRNEDNHRDLWDNAKHPKIRVRGVPEEEDKKKGHEKILEIIVENFHFNGEGNSHPGPRNLEKPPIQPHPQRGNSIIKRIPQTARIQKGHPKHSNINKMKRQRNTQQVKE